MLSLVRRAVVVFAVVGALALAGVANAEIVTGPRVHSCVTLSGDFNVFLGSLPLRSALENALRNDLAVAFNLNDTLPFRPKGAKVTITGMTYNDDSKTIKACYFVIAENPNAVATFPGIAGRLYTDGVTLTRTTALLIGMGGSGGNVTDSEPGVTNAPGVTDAPTAAPTAAVTDAPTAPITDSPTAPSATDAPAPGETLPVGIRVHSCMTIKGDYGVFLTTADLRRALEDALRNDIAVAFGLTDTLPFRPKGAKVTITDLSWDSNAKELRVCYFAIAETQEEADHLCVLAGQFEHGGLPLTRTCALHIGVTGNSSTVTDSDSGVSATDAPTSASGSEAPATPASSPLVGVRMHACMVLSGDFAVYLTTADLRRALENALRNDIAVAFGLTDTLPFRPKGAKVTITELTNWASNHSLKVCYFVVCESLEQAEALCIKAGEFATAGVALTMTSALSVATTGTGASVTDSSTGVTDAPNSPLSLAPTDAPTSGSVPDAPTAAPTPAGSVLVHAVVKLVGDFGALITSADQRRLLEDALRNDLGAAFGVAGVDVTIKNLEFTPDRILTVSYFVVASSEQVAAGYRTKAAQLVSSGVQLTRTAALYAGVTGSSDVTVSSSSNADGDGDVSGAATQAVAAVFAVAAAAAYAAAL